MAEAIVSIVMHKLVSTIQLELEQQVRQVAGVPKQVSKITKTLVSIKPLLHDAEMKQFGDSTVQEWLETLRDVMYDAELVLDDWNTLIHTGATPAKVRSYVSWFHRSVPGSDIALRIKGIRKRSYDIVHDKAELDLTLYQQAREVGVHSSIVEVPEEIYGRELDKRLILNKILAQGSHQETHIGQVLMYILGMGGLGKTTLAQLVFNDEEVKTYFECKIWVSISEPFHVERVAKEIIEQASGEDVENGVGWEVLNRRLLSSLEDKRYLLVLDDFELTESLMDWTPLKPALNSGAIGSRIIITASSQRVAGSSNETHMLTESEHICLNLFRHIAFWGRSEQEVGKLEEIGVEIASKCGGIPLAAKMVASLMRFKHTAAEWRSVLQIDLWELGEVFFPALLLSYHALPPYLKLCFMYTAIFPKGTRLEKDRLVKLWMAQSFAVSDGRKEPEMIAGEFFDALVTRSIFQDFEKDVDGNITSCRMHDFLHDLAESLTKNECHIMKRNDSIDLTNSKVRHLNALHIEGSSVFMGKGLRTLILNVPVAVQFLRDTFLQCTSLRALDLHGSDLIELPEEIDRLLHLRYLDLSDTRLSILPETVCNLYNLQTLKLNSCGELITLPEGIGGLSNLRHLEIKETPELTYFPESIGRLSRLRTLWKFLVSDESGGCKLGELRYLNDLAGSLAILRLWQVEDGDESRGADMLKKKDLRSLHLHFGFFWEGRNETEEEEIMRMESVIEGLQPNANLGKLLILSYPGFTFPFWMSSKSLLCNVVNIELWDCGNCIQLPALGYLESLEILNIGNFNCVKQIGAEFYGSDDTSFPKLKTLSIDGFPELEDWEIPFWKFKKVMPYLCNLELKRCGMLMGAGLPELGRLESLEELRIYHLDSLRELGPGFLGISADDGREGEQLQTVVFPKLKRLELNRMDEWEEEHWPYHQEKKNETLQIMPNLSVLWIVECPKLQVVLPYMFADSLIGIELNNCPKLARVPCLPPLLQQLKLNGDVGVISTSLIPFSSDHHDYANLRTVEIHHSPLSSLPPGLSKFTSLQQLDIRECEFLDLNPLEELRHFTMLQNLLIHNCEVITQRFFREDWTKTLLSRTVYTITIHVA